MKITRCRCGSTVELVKIQRPTGTRFYARCYCECCWTGPERGTPTLALNCWNKVMGKPSK